MIISLSKGFGKKNKMPFDSLKFCYPWRPYQQRVLDAIDQHLDDDRLHVVAAPGAGKTTLGLEVFRMLRKRTLVLSPTRVIRDQWIHRLDDFLDGQKASDAEWVSRSVREPGVFTSITYQALHAQFADDLAEEDVEEPEDDDAVEDLDEDKGVSESELNGFIETLKTHGVEVIIMDEAHHLRTEWWRALDKVCEALPEMVLVSLTATPPYDSPGHEWGKYEKLCGPIDEEISVPELVKAGTLCAHQDYIWAVDVSESARQRIREYDERVSTLCNSLFEDGVFREIILAHPWLGKTVDEREVIKQPRIAIALLTFLKARGLPISENVREMLDLTVEDIPDLGRHWWQTLVEAVLFSRTFEHSEAHQDFVAQLKKQLIASELLRKRDLSLVRSRRMNRSLSLSSSKIEACIEIHQLEQLHRGNELRQVVLTDYIRDEELRSGLDTGEINLGAWPVFKGMIGASADPKRIALLTGRISVVHESLLENLLQEVDQERFKRSAIGPGDAYRKVTGPLNQLTVAFTSLLMRGDIHVLIGTRALLGEGWDAPAINSLILASAVGSFMLTNQMRGRAIRIDKQKPDKISSVWHLVAIDVNSYSGLSNLDDLQQRFETFVGLSEWAPTIESGFERVRATGFDLLKTSDRRHMAVSSNNSEMTGRYEELLSVAGRWREALTIDDSARVLPSVMTATIPGIRTYHVKNTLKHLLSQLGGVLGAIFFLVLAVGGTEPSGLFVALSVAAFALLLYRLPKTIAVLRVFFKHLPVDGALKQIGVALSHALCQAGFIETSIRRVKVRCSEDCCANGTFSVALSGSTFYESSLFADCLAEILGPIDSPRYLVVREGTVFGLGRDDYHAVPIKLGAKKDTAMIFYKAWCRFVCPTELIYTRSDEGRKRLVKAKMRAFSSTFESQVKRQDHWQPDA